MMLQVSRAGDLAATNVPELMVQGGGRSRTAALVLLVAFVTALCASTSVAAREFSVPIGDDAVIHVIATGSETRPATAELKRWVQRAGVALHAYAGGLALPELYVTLTLDSGAGVYGGQALVSDPPLVAIRLGEDTSRRQFDQDWVLTHELAHTFVPDLPRQHLWFEEGFAGYVEAMARARAGQREAVDTWRYLHNGIEQGRPGPGHLGLDGARSWGRVYWASVEFFLRTDIALRRASDGAVGLPEIISAWRLEGLAMGRPGGLSELFDAARDAGAGDVLRVSWERVGRDGMPWNPDANWRELGLLDSKGVFDPDGARTGLHEQLVPRP